MAMTQQDILLQHNALVILLDSLVQRVQTVDPPHLFLVDLARIILTLRYHFADEESLMLENNYFDYAGQKRAHEVFLKLLDRLYDDATVDPSIIRHRAPLIADAIITHIESEEPLFNIEIFRHHENDFAN